MGTPELGAMGLPSRSLAVDSRVLCQLLNLCWHWTGSVQGTRMGGSLPPHLLLLALEVTTDKRFQSLSASDIAMLVPFALSAKDYEEWEGKLIIRQTIAGGEEGFHLSRSDHNKAAILSDWSQATAAAISHPAISFRHTQLTPEQKNRLHQRSGAGKAVSDFLTLFFLILISSPPSFLTAAAHPSLDNI